MSNNEVGDRRVRRTRSSLQAALLELLHEKRLSKIHITEIAERADISRPTFYLHFESKEDLLFSYLDDLFDEIQEAMVNHVDKSNQLDVKSMTLASFELWAEHAETWQWVMQAENKERVIERLRAHVAFIMRESRQYRTDSITEIHDDFIYECSIDFLTGGVYMLLRRWIGSGMAHSAEEMGLMAYRLMGDFGELKPRN